MSIEVEVVHRAELKTLTLDGIRRLVDATRGWNGAATLDVTLKPGVAGPQLAGLAVRLGDDD